MYTADGTQNDRLPQTIIDGKFEIQLGESKAFIFLIERQFEGE
ncbi:MAG: hypothetical protein QXX17_01875 [Conexivisphaerales archaeon]